MATRVATFPLGVSLHTIDPDQRLETMQLLAGSAVRAVELWEPTFAKDAAFVQAARRALSEAGVTPRTVHANFAGSLDLSSLDAGVRAAGLQAFRVALDLAVGMGARLVVVHPSSEPIGDGERAARLEQSRLSLVAIARQARDAGCQVAIELLPRSCLGRSAEELVALLDGVDAASAGACLDTNHLMGAHATLPAVVRTLGSRLVALHASDYDGVDEKHWPPGRGVIAWPALLAALREVGFPGPLHYEATLEGKTPAERLAFVCGNYAALVAQCAAAAG